MAGSNLSLNSISLLDRVRQVLLRRWLMVPVGLRRSFGLMADFSIASMLAVVPYLVHVFGHPELLTSFTVDFSHPHSAARLAILLLPTPIPLVALRCVCRIWMRSPTPGELLSGYMILTGKEGLGGFQKQCRLAMLQYVFLFVSIAVAFPISLKLVGLLNQLPPFFWLGEYISETGLFFIVWLGCTLLTLWYGLGFDKENRSDLEQLEKASVKCLVEVNEREE